MGIAFPWSKQLLSYDLYGKTASQLKHTTHNSNHIILVFRAQKKERKRKAQNHDGITLMTIRGAFLSVARVAHPLAVFDSAWEVAQEGCYITCGVLL